MYDLCVSGHRPSKLFESDPYSFDNFIILTDFAQSRLLKHKPSEVLTGMALGWDLAVALACMRLGLPFIAALPCPEQDARWPKEWQKHYQHILSNAAGTYVVSPTYHGGVMQLRNRWMADTSTRALLLWDGSAGGTGNFVDYASTVELPMKNCWKLWKTP